MKIGFNLEAIAKLNNYSLTDDQKRLTNVEFSLEVKQMLDYLSGEKHEIYIFAPSNQQLPLEQKIKIKQKLKKKMLKYDIPFSNLAVVSRDELVDAAHRNYIGVMIERDKQNVIEMNKFTDAICAQYDAVGELIRKTIECIDKNRQSILDDDVAPTDTPSKDQLWLKNYCVGDFKWSNDFYSPYERILRSNVDFLDETFMEYFGNHISYASFFEEVDKVCNALLARGIKKGDKIPLILANTPESFVLLNALIKAKATIVPIFPLSTEEDIKNKLLEVDHKYVFISDICYSRVKNVVGAKDKVVVLPVSNSMPYFTKLAFETIIKKKMKMEKVTYNDQFIDFDNFISQSPQYDGEIDLSYEEDYVVAQMYTGGTVKAKGVMLTNENFESAVHSYLNDIYKITRQDKFAAFLPFNHVFGLVIGTYMATTLGVKLDVVLKINFKKIHELFLKDKITIFGGIPTMFSSVINNAKLQKSDLSHIKYILSGGAAITPTQVDANNQFFRARNSSAITIDGYGKTETAGGVIYNNIPIVNTKVKIVKVGTTEELGYDEKGELCISGPSVMLGHLKDNDNPHALQYHDDGNLWLHTDDAAYIASDGKVYITGRLDRMIKVNGECVWIEEIESELMKHPAISSCAIVGKSDAKKGSVPVAFITLSKNYIFNDELKNNIEQFYEEKLVYFARPVITKELDKLPLTQLGKIDFKKLEKDAELLEKPRVKILK